MFLILVTIILSYPWVKIWYPAYTKSRILFYEDNLPKVLDNFDFREELVNILIDIGWPIN